MWIIVVTEEVIKSPKEIEIGGIKYPKQIFNDKALLLSLGIKPYREEKNFDERYYWQGALTRTDNGSEVIGTYGSTPRDIAQLKEVMLSDLRTTFENKRKRPRVSVTIGTVTFDVDGSRDDILNFEDGKALGVTQIKDADGVFHTVTSADYDTIIAAQKANGLALYNTKWTKEAEINALVTLDDCILYEATPYTYTFTANDTEVIAGTKVVGDTEPRVRNNVRDW